MLFLVALLFARSAKGDPAARLSNLKESNTGISCSRESKRVPTTTVEARVSQCIAKVRPIRSKGGAG